MKIAIASGKGGTGKTTVVTSLATVFAQKPRITVLRDCDVEEPNSHIFTKPEIRSTEEVHAIIPELDEQKCNSCGKCENICEFNAIFYTNGKPLFFDDICHSCRLCERICPTNAIGTKKKKIGNLYKGNTSENIKVVYGTLDIGQVAVTKIIDKVLEDKSGSHVVDLLDCPPGTSCSVVESIKDSDYVVLVTEPTPFGLHDLDLAVNMCKNMNKKFGVIINRSDIGDNSVKDYCEKNNIKILGTIPFLKDLAHVYSEGKNILSSLPQLRSRFLKIASSIEGECEL